MIISISGHSKSGRFRSHGAGNDRIQDETVGPGPRPVAQHSKLLLQCMVEHSCLQAYEGFSKIRLFSGMQVPY